MSRVGFVGILSCERRRSWSSLQTERWTVPDEGPFHQDSEAGIVSAWLQQVVLRRSQLSDRSSHDGGGARCRGLCDQDAGTMGKLRISTVREGIAANTGVHLSETGNDGPRVRTPKTHL